MQFFIVHQSICLLILLFFGASSSDQRGRRGIKALQEMMNQHQINNPGLGFCNFETRCDWEWDRINGTFELVKAPLDNPRGPIVDGSNRSDGEFIF